MNKYDIYSNSKKLEKTICKWEDENNTNRLIYDIPNKQKIQNYISDEYDILHDIITTDLLDRCKCEIPYHSFNITKPSNNCFTTIPNKDINKIYKSFNNPDFKFLDLDVIYYYSCDDLENLYDIIYYKNKYYLIEYSVILLYETREKIENSLFLPFINLLHRNNDIESYLELATNNFNCVLGVKIFTIPNNIKKPKKYGYCVDNTNILCYYKINNDFIKNVINSIFIRNKPKYNDDYLINLFNENKVVKKKKKRVKQLSNDSIALQLSNDSIALPNDRIELSNDSIASNNIKLHLSNDRIALHLSNDRIAFQLNKHKIELNNDTLEKQKIFKLEFYYNENNKDFYINLFNDLYDNNNNFKQMILIFVVKNIIIYKSIDKSYTNDIYINCCINNINYHAYLNNEKSKIIRLTRILNVI